MKNRLKSAALKAKNAVVDHRGTIIFAACTTVYVANMLRSAKVFNDFLAEKGIDPLEFTCPEWYEELMNK